MMKLKDKVAIVTGASAGMGQSIAKLFAEEGARVFALARRLELLEEMAKVAAAKGQTIIPVKCDIGNDAEIEAAVALAVEQYGTVDILINNAGILDNMLPIHELDDEMWDRVMQINLTGPMRITRSVTRIMLENGGGSIVNVASIGGVQGGRAGAAYTASKFAIVGLTKNVGFMYADKGIRCNAICPGGVATDIASGLTAPSRMGIERTSAGKGANPRMGQPEEIATVALFLASADSSFINGETILADGGWAAY